MKQKRLTVIAGVCGSICALCIVLFMIALQREADAARAEELARYGGEQVEVCVAKRDIAAGERLDASAVETKLWIAGLLPEGAVQDGAEVFGETASSPILKGEVVSAKRFERQHNALEVPAGKQAISVPVKTVQAVGGTLAPGMRVNLYASGDTSTSVLASDVLVLDSSTADGSSSVVADTGWVTLAIDAEKAQEVIAASQRTSLYFALPGDQGERETRDE